MRYGRSLQRLPVIALPGSERTTRGYAGARMVILDEAARVADSYSPRSDRPWRPWTELDRAVHASASEDFSTEAGSETTSGPRSGCPPKCPRFTKEYLDEAS